MKKKLTTIIIAAISVMLLLSLSATIVGCNNESEDGESFISEIFISDEEKAAEEEAQKAAEEEEARKLAEEEAKKKAEEEAKQKEEHDNLEAFLNTVKESQLLLDEIGDEIYSNWHDAIYNNKFYKSIDLAIAYAMSTKQEQVDTVKANDTTIAELFTKCKNLECGDLVKETMSAYSDYYEFVINVSGAFKSYSADKETKKKALATALRTLSYEL